MADDSASHNFDKFAVVTAYTLFFILGYATSPACWQCTTYIVVSFAVTLCDLKIKATGTTPERLHIMKLGCFTIQVLLLHAVAVVNYNRGWHAAHYPIALMFILFAVCHALTLFNAHASHKISGFILVAFMLLCVNEVFNLSLFKSMPAQPL